MVAHANTTIVDEEPSIPKSVTIHELPFLDAHEHLDDDTHFYDPSDDLSAPSRLGKAFHLTIDYEFVRTHQVDTMLDQLPDDELYGYNEPFDTFAYGMRTAATLPNAERLQPFLGYRPLEVIRRTLENTTQLGATVNYHNLKAHLKSLLPWANRTRLNETVSTDTVFANERDVTGAVCAQVFYGLRSHMINVYGMRSESEGSERLDDFIREEGIPSVMRSDNSRMQRYGKVWLQWLRELLIHAEYSEPHNQQQNPVELRAVRWLKEANKVLLKRTGAPGHVWLQAMQYLADIHNVTSDETLDWRTPKSVRVGTQTDISPYLQYQFWEPVVFLDTEETFPSTKEKLGRWVGVAQNVGDFFCWKIYDELTETIIERSTVTSRLHNPNLAAEAEFKRQAGITGKDTASSSSDSDSSDQEKVSFSSTKIKVNTNVERRNRLRTRRELKKAQKRHKQYLREQAKIGAGNPTATQSVQEIIIDDIMHGLALHPDTRHTILEEDESTQIPESANSGENEPAASLDVQSPIPSGEDNRTIHIPASGEEEAQPTVLPENGGSEPYISFDVEPSPPRKDPLLPSPALKEPNLVVRRSARNVNKPSRFRALMAHTTDDTYYPSCWGIGGHP